MLLALPRRQFDDAAGRLGRALLTSSERARTRFDSQSGRLSVRLLSGLVTNYQEKLFLAGLTAARQLGNGWSAGITLYGQAYKYLSTIDLRGAIDNNSNLIIQSTRRQRIAPIDLLLIGGFGSLPVQGF